MLLKQRSAFGLLGYSLLIAGLVCSRIGLASSASTTVSVSECGDLAELNAALQIGDVTAEFGRTVSCVDWTTVTDFVVGGVGDDDADADGYELTIVAQDPAESGGGRGKLDLVNIRFHVWSSLIVVPDVAFGSSDSSYTQVGEIISNYFLCT